MRRERLWSLVAAGVAGVVFAVTAAPRVTLVDAGELVVAAATLGVAHPPGFPVWVLVTHLLIRVLPTGAVHAAALGSALWGAVGVGLFAAVGAGLARAGGSGREAFPAAAAAALALAFSRPFWRYATVVEVYTLTLAVVAVVLLVAVRYAAAERGSVITAGALGLAAGLGLGTHHVTVALSLPAAAVLAWRGRPRLAELVGGAVGGIGGLAAYLEPPLAARAGVSPLLWGDPGDLTRLWRHVSGWQYRVYLFEGGWSAVAARASQVAGALTEALTPVGLVLAVAGFVALWRTYRRGAVACLLLVVPPAVYAAAYEIAEDRDAYLLLPLAGMALLAGVGLARLFRRKPRWVSATLVLPAVLLAAGFSGCDRRTDRVAVTYVRDAVGALPPGSVLLTADWQLYSPYLARAQLEGFRPDVAVVDVNLVRRSWYVRRFLPRAAPDLAAACAGPAAALLAPLERWEAGERVDPSLLTRRFRALLDCYVAWGLAHGGAFVTVPMEPGIGRGLRAVPWGLALALVPAGGGPPAGEPNLDPRAVLAAPAAVDRVALAKVRGVYAAALARRAAVLERRGRRDQARALLETASRLVPGDHGLRRFPALPAAHHTP